MEAHVASAEDQLVPGLSYKLPNAANFIHSRDSVTQFCQAGNQYSPTGVRLVRFQLSDGMGGGGGGAFLDPSTVRLSYTIRNTGTEDLKVQANSPVIFFQRMRMLLNGTLVEDISYLGRLHQMLDYMLPINRRISHTNTSFGQLTSGSAMTFGNNVEAEVIPAGQSRKVFTSLPSGLLNQHAYLPLKYAPLTVELEVVQDPTIACVPSSSSVNRSTSFEITDVQIKCDVCTVDQALSEQISKHLVSGKSLPLAFSSYSTTMNVISPSHTDGAFAIQLARAFTRIRTVFMTMRSQLNMTAGLSEVNDLFCPHGYADNYQYDKDTMEFQMQVGTQVMPQYPIRSLAEFYYQLEKAMNTYASIDGMSILADEYRSNKFIVGIDTEKAAVGPGGGGSFPAAPTPGPKRPCRRRGWTTGRGGRGRTGATLRRGCSMPVGPPRSPTARAGGGGRRGGRGPARGSTRRRSGSWRTGRAT